MELDPGDTLPDSPRRPIRQACARIPLNFHSTKDVETYTRQRPHNFRAVQRQRRVSPHGTHGRGNQRRKWRFRGA
jgi:hypothetical protein